MTWKHVLGKVWCALLFLLFAMGLSTSAQAQSTLLITTDLDCNLRLDGKLQGQLNETDPKVVKVSSGKHIVQATSFDGLSTSRVEVEVGLGRELVEIALKENHTRALERATKMELIEHPTWTDRATGLTWTRADKGGTWNEVLQYCGSLQLNGHHDWNLPSINELQAIYNGGVPVKEHFRLSGVEWSIDPAPTTPGTIFGSQLYIRPGHLTLDFKNGNRVSYEEGGPAAGLCVRKSGEGTEDVARKAADVDRRSAFEAATKDGSAPSLNNPALANGLGLGPAPSSSIVEYAVSEDPSRIISRNLRGFIQSRDDTNDFALVRVVKSTKLYADYVGPDLHLFAPIPWKPGEKEKYDATTSGEVEPGTMCIISLTSDMANHKPVGLASVTDTRGTFKVTDTTGECYDPYNKERKRNTHIEIGDRNLVFVPNALDWLNSNEEARDYILMRLNIGYVFRMQR